MHFLWPNPVSVSPAAICTLKTSVLSHSRKIENRLFLCVTAMYSLATKQLNAFLHYLSVEKSHFAICMTDFTAKVLQVYTLSSDVKSSFQKCVL